MNGLYIHIPFCKKACHYCDFHFSTNLTLVPEIVKSITKELEDKSNSFSRDLTSIYLGGGTPSILPFHELEKIFDSIALNYNTTKVAEITVECNPDDINVNLLEMYSSLKINRLSIGIQSTNISTLQYSNRNHTPEQAINSVKLAQKMGFENITIDLIYGFPNESIDDLNKSIDDIILLQVPHISAYALTIEEKTVFGNWNKKQKIKELPDELFIEQYELVVSKLIEAGYIQYEISNFAKPGFEAVHNSNYWKGVPYIGIGPSAHSFDGKNRFANIANNAKYINKIANGENYFETETLTREDLINEYLLISLRTIWGCDLQFLLDLDYDLMEIKNSTLMELISDELICIKKNTILLTDKGKLLADFITSKLYI